MKIRRTYRPIVLFIKVTSVRYLGSSSYGEKRLNKITYPENKIMLSNGKKALVLNFGSMVKRLSHHPVTVESRVQFSLGSFKSSYSNFNYFLFGQVIKKYIELC